MARLAESSSCAGRRPVRQRKVVAGAGGTPPGADAGTLQGGASGARWRLAREDPTAEAGRALETAPRTVRRALRHSSCSIDQFEETFSSGADHHEQDEFIDRSDGLADRDPPTAVVLAVRAHHLGRAANTRSWPSGWREATCWWADARR